MLGAIVKLASITVYQKKSRQGHGINTASPARTNKSWLSAGVSQGCRFNTVSGQQGQIKVAQGSQADLV